MKKRLGLMLIIAGCTVALWHLRVAAPGPGPEPGVSGAEPRAGVPDPVMSAGRVSPALGALAAAQGSAGGNEDPARGGKPSSYRTALFGQATVLEDGIVRRDAQGRERQARLVKVPHKYPLLRVERTVIRDPVTGVGTELPEVAMVADHILVKLREGASVDDLHQLNASAGAVLRKALRSPGLYLVAFPEATLDLVPEQVAAYSDAAAVIAYAEPDYIVFATSTFPNDPRFSELHGLHNTGQTGGIADSDVDAPEAWDLTTGDGTVVVGVIDSGIDYQHEDLAANAWVNPGEIPGNDRDDDGNGFVDDVHGWDFANDDSDPFDDGEHGTHVSGIIAGVGNNGIGIAGMSWNTQVLGLKFLLGSGTGATSDAIDALNYATMMRGRGINIRLTNNSWGGGGFSQALLEAIIAGADEDILFVAAAGNDAFDNDAFPHYPSSYDHPGIIAVANTTDRDELSLLSNFGAVSVDLSAPGSDILSTTPGDTYSVFSGTSMATPLVAGLATLVWTLDPDAGYEEVRDAILDGVDLAPDLVGKVATAGRLNALQTLEQLGMLVRSSKPAGGSVIGTPPSAFEIRFSDDYDPVTVEAADFTVNGRIADHALRIPPDAVLFRYASSPAGMEGLHTMALAEDAVVRLSDGDGLAAWTGSFRYDAVPMEVTATVPGNHATVDIPFLSLRVQLNEPVHPDSVSVDDLVVSVGRVTGAALVSQEVVEYSLSGVDQEGAFTVDLLAGALTDLHGNPSLAYQADYVLDFGTVPAGAFQPIRPAGSLAYALAIPGTISTTSDVDRFTVDLDPDQLLTVVVEPGEFLQPSILIRDPGRTVRNHTVAVAPGDRVLASGISVASPGTYTVEVSGGGVTAGAYDLSIELNVIREAEEFDGAANDSAGTSQPLDPAFIPVGEATRASVLGDPGIAGSGPAPILTETEPNDDGIPDGSLADLAFANDWSGSFVAVETNRYEASLTGEISAGSDAGFDFFTILASPGDRLEVSLSGAPSGAGTLGDPYLRLYDRTGSQIAFNDDFDNLDSFIRFDAFAYAGEYFVVADSFGDSTGTYRLDGVIFSPELMVARSPGDDWYRFSAQAGQGLSLVVVGLDGNAPTLELSDDGGLTVAAIAADVPGVGRAILDYPAADTGLHHVRVTGNQPYHLFVSRGALFSLGNNTDQGSAQVLSYTDRVLGQTGEEDAWFAFSVRAGDTIGMASLTPGDAPLQFENRLDPVVELFSPTHVLLTMDDNSSPDGRNVSLSHTATSAGVFRARVTASDSTAGEFLLAVTGATGEAPAFQVAATSPADGELLGVEPEQLEVSFSGLLRPGSVDVTDLLVDGAPATAVTQVDGDSLLVEFLPLSHGSHTVTLLAGAVTNIAGEPNQAFSMTIDVDVVPPSVVASSIQEGDVLPVGDLVFTARFSESLDGGLLDAGDLALEGDHAGLLIPYAFAYDPTQRTVTASYASLPDDQYVLTLFSAPDAFQDPAGHWLDGEPLNWPIPTNASGDGVAGGDFLVRFTADVTTNVLPAAWRLRPPAGALIHEATLTTRLDTNRQTDRYTLDLEAGQVLSVVASSPADVQPFIELWSAANGLIGSSTAGAPGEAARLQALPISVTGSYAIDIGAVGPETGAADLTLLLNLALEQEAVHGVTNDHPAGSEDLDVGAVSVIPGQAIRSAVTGSPAGAPSVPALSDEIEPNDDGVDGGSAADLPFANDWSGSFVMSGPDRSRAAVGGEIESGSDADWDFFRLLAGPGDTLEINLHGGASGLGTLDDPYLRLYDEQGTEIASNDDGGEGLESFIRYSDFTYRGSYYVVADSFGSSAGRYVLTAEHLSSQQVNAETSGEDWYHFSMTNGATVSLVLAAEGPGPLALELHDSSRRAAGIPTGNAAGVIDGFVADADGLYYARVTGTAPYTLLLLRGARFERESNNNAAEAQIVDGAAAVLGHLDGNETEGDFLTFDVGAGDALMISTRTPGDGPGAFDNFLDPGLELYDPTGTPVASDDNSGPDGRNARVTHTAVSAGRYALKIAPAGGTSGSGEYVVELSGATGTGAEMRVVHSTPAGGATMASLPDHITLTFSGGIDLASLDPSDVRVNGLASPGLTVIDGRTVAFEIPPVPGGVYPVWMAGGAVTDLTGAPVKPTYFLFFVDGPRVVASTLQEGDSLLPGAHEIMLTFDRGMAEAELDATDVALNGARRGSIVPTLVEYSSIAPTASVLHIVLPQLMTDAYTLTLFSGNGQFEDQAGSNLDGENTGLPIPPHPSGNGIAGGDFVLAFTVAYADADGDGLSDDWENRHNLDPNDDGSVNPDFGAKGDPDGDGASNEQEQAGGTNPRDPNSIFALSALTPGPGTISIRVSTEPGRQYTVEYSAEAAWHPFANPANGIGTWLETNTSPSHFSFIDDFSPDTTGTPPRTRSYRVRTTSE